MCATFVLVYSEEAEANQEQSTRLKRSALPSPSLKTCSAIKKLPDPKRIQILDTRRKAYRITMRSLRGEGQGMVRLKKCKFNDKHSVEFKFDKAYSIRDIQMCCFNKKITGNRIGMDSIAVKYLDKSGNWRFIEEGPGETKVFTMANNHTSVNMPPASEIRIFPQTWALSRAHIYLPAFKGCE